MTTLLPLFGSPGMTIALTVAIAVILLAANFTIINAQQPGQQLTSQPRVIGNGAAAAPTTFQSTNDSFSIQVPGGWIIHDVNNTGSALLDESSKGYGMLAQLCPEEGEQQQGAAASLRNASGGSTNNRSIITSGNNCQGAQEVIHVIRYPDLVTRIQPANNITAYHLQKLQEVGYRGIDILNSTTTTVNITNPQTNQTIATIPAKTVEMTYNTNFTHNETRTGYFILTATNVTAPNVGTTKGYSIFYEGNSTAGSNSAATPPTITRTSAAAISGSLSPTPVLPAVAQVFDSFQLITPNSTANATTMNARPLSPFQQQQQTPAGQTGEGDAACHPSYPDVCIPPPPPNLNCDDVSATNFKVLSPDPHGFDGNDNDGIGCETSSGGSDDSGGDDGDGGGGDSGGGDGGDAACHPSYPDVCIPPPPPNLNCDDDGVPENFKVVGSDPHGFDGNDNDGIGCETSSGGSDDSGGDDGDGGGGGDTGGGDEGGGTGGGDEGGGTGGGDEGGGTGGGDEGGGTGGGDEGGGGGDDDGA